MSAIRVTLKTAFLALALEFLRLGSAVEADATGRAGPEVDFWYYPGLCVVALTALTVICRVSALVPVPKALRRR